MKPASQATSKGVSITNAAIDAITQVVAETKHV
jgi:hypothetical protein